jgi:N-methylhydantoinase A/oxoprolinase/acetone carboxylase beta subunit
MFPGGVLGYGLTTFPEFGGQPIVGFDMGGTSTGGWLEVSLMDAINLFTL